jgi:hypothetical protein
MFGQSAHFEGFKGYGEDVISKMNDLLQFFVILRELVPSWPFSRVVCSNFSDCFFTTKTQRHEAARRGELQNFVNLSALVTFTCGVFKFQKLFFSPRPRGIRHPAERHQYMKVHEESFTSARLKNRRQYYCVFP